MSTVAGLGHQATAAPGNLPHHLTTFVGRQAELSSLRSLLRASRLVTLTGTGGAGKSRLAAEVAHANRDAWPDGVWWVELAGESDAPGAVVAMLELPGRGAPQDVIASWLAARRSLLILDNCEHLIASCAALCQALLERCAHLSVLSTSREALGVPGEARWPVSALAQPDALSLFEARARLVRPDFKLAPHNRDVVATICDRVDRLPLAIEMAATRLDLMSEQELLANLDHRFRLLASASRTAPERQQTMTAAIDWSHRLLTTDEARLWRRLAVFHGGFTLAAAEAVCSEPGAQGVLETLAALVQKSMVVADRLEEGTTRYRLLESHHAYAVDRLNEAGDLESISRRHYEHFRRQSFTPREAANFWAAIVWARDRKAEGRLELAFEIADSEFSDQGRARSLLLDLLGQSPARDAVRARALNLAARLASRQADHASARTLAGSSIELARELGEPEVLAEILNGAGMVYHAAGELDVSSRMYDEAIRLLKGSSNRGLAVEVQNHLGWLAIEQGDCESAVTILEPCIAHSRAVHDKAGTARFLESLANAQLGVGDVPAASASWTESLEIYRGLDDPFGSIWCFGGLALASAARRDDQRTLRLAAVADRMSREWSLSALSFRINQLEEACRKTRQRLGPEKSEAAWNEGLEMSQSRALDYALHGRAMFTAPGDESGPLTRREREVAGMVAAGMTNKEIAKMLFIAERTAEGHVERIRNKLGVRSRTEVATWALGHGFGKPALDKTQPKSKV